MNKKTMLMSDVSENLFQVIRKRRSVRQFADAAIPGDVLSRLVEAGIWAPSGSNSQNQRFLVIDDKKEIERIGLARFVWPYKNADHGKVRLSHPAGIVGNAAAVIIVFADSYESDRRGRGEYYLWQTLEIQNCAASMQNILLFSTSLGIASCWISASEEMSFTRLLSGCTWRRVLADYEIPGHYKIQGIILLGYPRQTDADGFPTGEVMHGATTWQSTDRKPVENYLIKKRIADRQKTVLIPTILQKARLRIMSRGIHWLLVLVRWLDRSIHRLEIDTVFNRENNK
ncbi:MAG: nitroreductase family protein [bacterium]